ncbi:glycosyltransferase [bacterium]|nr:glycosyltransferase [bacterium]
MKILFNTENKEAVSTVLNLQKLDLLNNIEGVDFVSFRDDYENYDIILLMGYDFNIKSVREKNPGALIGVIDPRPSQDIQPEEADFILANGIEMRDYYSSQVNIFDYYIYPNVSLVEKECNNSDKIIICYHGNKIHLKEAVPRITDAIEKLGDDFNIELKVIYNVEKFGKINWKPKKINLNYVQWNEKVYGEHLSKSDIGIIPGLIPSQESLKAVIKKSFFKREFNEHKTDYLLRFKASSNPGRIFPFMQCGIPVVSDMFPSAHQIINDGFDSFVVYSTEAWYNKLKVLIENVELRKEMGKKLQEKFDKYYSPEILNNNFVVFLKKLLNNK